MDKTELLKRISNGEDSYTQFKVDITNADKLSQELVAFSNAKGGLLIIGVDDYGKIVGLEEEDIRRLNQLIGNVINTHIIPPIYPLVKIENIDTKKILVITILEGVNKPYSTNKGVYLTKAGSDKRKISPQELRRLFAESNNLFPDEEIVAGTSFDDLNMQLFYTFLKRFDENLYNQAKNKNIDIKYLLQNFDIMNGDSLTLAGNVIFGIEPQRFNKSFYVDCCYFDGNDVSVTKYISERRSYGDIQTLFEKATDFIKSNIRNVQVEDDFNSNGVPEIPYEVIGELVTNALIHRDYYINSPIKIFMFHNRVEIISPGKLFNSLTVEKIKLGTSIRRNQTLDRICGNILTYTGRGSGIKRVLKLHKNVEFINDQEMEQFKVIVYREKLGTLAESVGVNQENVGVNQENVGVNDKSVGVNDKSVGVNDKSVGVKTSDKILKFIASNPYITIVKLAELTGVSKRSVERNIKKLQEAKLLFRVGSDKNGHWEINNEI